MQDEIWGKSSGISLVEHTGNVLQAVSVLQKKKLSNVPDEWWIALWYAALLHDLGKIDPHFQATVKKIKDIFSGANIPHSLLSLFLFKPELFNFDNSTTTRIIISAVAFHHWRESFLNFMMGAQSYDISTKAEEFVTKKEEWIDRYGKVANQIKELAKHYRLNEKVIGINETLIDYLRVGTRLIDTGILTPPYTLTFLPDRLKNEKSTEDEKFRIFVAGNLMRADHFASLVEDSKNRLKIEDIVHGKPSSFKIIDNRLKTEFNKSDYWQKEFFTNNPELQKETMILVAPTGFGKTEFAYLWGAGLKNFMLLPMQVATNKIFERTQNLYGEDQVSLLHGDASLELFIRAQDKKQENSIKETEGERRKAMDLARHLAKPYIIATADQIVPSALRYPGYERIFSILMDSGLIIDEIQAYDPRAAAIVTHLLQQNNFLGGKTLIMTATLPLFIQKEITKRVGLEEKQIVNLLDQPKFAEIADSVRHRVQFLIHEGDYETVINKAIENALSGQKILIVMNTVFAARTIYERISNELKDRNINIRKALLHSRFTTQRCKELETLIVDQYMPNKPDRSSEPCIVVSTQKVEASLDIDADIIFTEPTPADNLVQRMGRCYRQYAHSVGLHAPEKANVFIIINSRNTKKGWGAMIGSGIGTVYNRDLTAITLIILANGFENQAIEKATSPALAEEPWSSCFRPWKKQKIKDINTKLCNIIHGLEGKNMLLSERQKMEWVNQTYELLAANEQFNLGNYTYQYYETLKILDHGYCSDKKWDAMKLFRDVNEITGVPEGLAKDFYNEIRQLVKGNPSGLSYEELATTILPKYIVACPYRKVVTWEGDIHCQELDLGQLIPEESDTNMHDTTYKRLERWLSGLVILKFPYDQEMGLNYFDA